MNSLHLRDRAPVTVEALDDGEIVEARTPFLVEPAVHGSLADLPFINAGAEPDAAVMSRRDGSGGWRDVTAEDFAAQVAAAAKGLMATGLQPGARVLLMSRTCYEWTLFDFALWAAGAAVVPVYPTASAEQVMWILHDSHATAALAEDGAAAELIRKAGAAAGREVPVWRFDRDAAAELAEHGAGLDDHVLARRRAALNPGSEATVIYTSGTTGRPKGVPLTHGNFLTESANCVELLRPVFESVSDEPPSTLLFLPLAHVLGRVIEICCVEGRIRFGHSPSIKPEDLRPELEGFGATFVAGVPYLFEKIHQLGRFEAQAVHAAGVYDRADGVAVEYGRTSLEKLAGEGPGPSRGLRAKHALYDALVYRKVRKALGGRIRYAISGGSSLSPELLLFFAGAGVLIYEGYGLTETTGPATVNPPLRPRPGTVGPPTPGSAVRVAEDGEVWLRGPQVFRGYMNTDEGAPADDGWFATGDLGRLDPDGYLTITGRRKEILVTSGGKNVSPGPLEDRLRSHPLVSQCMVVGDGRNYVAAIVTLDAEAMGHFVRHVGGAGQVTAMPESATGPAAEGGSGKGGGSHSGGSGTGSGRGSNSGGASDPTAAAAADTTAAGASAGIEVSVSTAVPVLAPVLGEIAAAVRMANASVSRAESIRRARIVAGDFTVENGLLTPSLKTKRGEVSRSYREDIEALYR